MLLMNEKEMRNARMLFEMLHEHESKPIIKLDIELEIDEINSAYSSFIETSTRLNEKLQALACSVLQREVGLRPGMVVKIAAKGCSGNATVIKIESLRLINSNALSSAPQQWEWRIYGELQSHGSKTPTMIDYSLGGDISIERAVLNGAWIRMVGELTGKHKAVVNG
jgi:hypothetical protein